MLLTVLVSAGLVGLDQFIKWLVVQALAPDGARTVLPGVVELRYVENDGAAFSMLAGQQGLLIGITSIALLAVAFVLIFRRPKGKLAYSALLMIFTGGVGNLIDRVANGYVVDYINLLFVRFAVFNFADILVCVGFGILLAAVIRSEWKTKHNQNDGTRQAGGPHGPN